MTERRGEGGTIKWDTLANWTQLSGKACTRVRHQGFCVFCEGFRLYYCLFVYLSIDLPAGLLQGFR